jgi:hypothetical protein
VAVVNATTVKINVKDVVNAGKLPASTGVISSGNMLYGNSSGEVSSLAAPATGGVLVFSSVTGIPAWSMPTSGSVFIGSSLGIPAWTPAGTPGYLLQSTSGRATWKSPVRYVSAQVIASTVALATGDDKIRIHIPPDINGYDLTYVHAMVNATSADSTTMLIQVYNLTDTTDMLTSGIEIDGGEKGSETATSAAVINAAADDVATNDILRIDLDAVGSTAPKGMLVTLGFSLP